MVSKCRLDFRVAALMGMVILLQVFAWETSVSASGRYFVDRKPLPESKTGPVKVEITVPKTYNPINKFVYGQSLENLSSWFGGGLCSEMPGGGSEWIIARPNINARNIAGEKTETTLAKSSLSHVKNPLSDQPISLCLYRINLE